jgi:hypothetical protein
MGNNFPSVWDREQCLQLTAFSNRSSEHSPGSHATQITFINEHDSSMLLTGSGNFLQEFSLNFPEDGVVRIYGDVATKPHLVSSWGTIPRDSSQAAGLVLHWDQETGALVTVSNG